MFKSVSIKAKLLSIVISSIVIVSAAMVVQSVLSLQHESEVIINKFKIDSYKTKEEELKNYISLAMKTVESYYERTAIEKIKQEVENHLVDQTGFIFSILEGEYKKYNGKIPDAQLKDILINAVKSVRYGQDGYFWINDLDAKIVMHPIKPHLDGKDLSNFKDKGGKKIFAEFAKVAKTSGQGVVDYVWPKPGYETPQPKVSIVRLFKPYGWVIGTGAYVSDVTSKLQKEALKTIASERYGKSGYFWINDSTPKMIMHPIKPALNGKNLSGVKDTAGKFLFNEMAKVANAKKEGGLVKYMWAKPGKDAPQQKFSYVQKFEQWDWIIGTGVYVDDIEDKIATMQSDTEEEIRNTIIQNIIIIFVIMILLALVMGYISNKVIFDPLKSFQDGLLDFFKYINKENSDVRHLDDSSNDEIGTMAKIINENVVKTKTLIEQDEALIQDVKRVVGEIKNGHLTKEVEKSTENEGLQELKIIINDMLRIIESNVDGDINKITKVLEEFKKLDFTHKIENPTGNVSKGLNDLSDIINNMLLDNLRNGSVLEENASTLSSNVENLSTSSNEQAASLEETAAALEEITSTIVSTTDNISHVATYSNSLTKSIKAGQELAAETVKAMDEINSQTQAIADAITVIDQIAFQTNILSLNAAVEAATAGEAGKGFAVVAQEVRNLASRSADAAKEIKELVENATAKTDAGKQSADKMIAGYDELNENIHKTTETINDIANASKEQQAGIEQINDAVTTLDQGTQRNAAVASETAEIATNTSEMARQIVDEANRADFIGKKDIVIRKEVVDPQYEGREKRKLETQRTQPKPRPKAKPVLENKKREIPKREIKPATPKVVSAQNSSDDEWESF